MGDALDDAAARLAKSHPESDPQPGELEARREAYRNLRDTTSAAFDPQIHATSHDGTPKVSARNGKLVRKRGRYWGFVETRA